MWMRLGLLVFVLLGSAACTATKPPDYRAMAEKNEIVPGDEITVQRSENLYAFAKRNGVRMSEVIALNNLKPPFVVRPGQKIVLPSRDEKLPLGADGAPVPRAAPLSEIHRVPLDKSSTSVTAVPLEPPVSTSAPAPTPVTAPTPASVRSSTSSVGTGTGTTVMREPSAHTEEKEQDETPVLATAGASVETGLGAAAVAPVPASKQDWKAGKASGSGSGLGAPQFVWPVQGPILSGFGIKGQGLNNDGINIAAPKGSPVVAAAGGMVAYAGNDMKGFGNLILIRHEGGWVTAYAHLDRMIVTKDSAVASGDMIGTVGTSGGVAAPQLHFETRQDGKPVDPEGVIKK